MAATKRNAGLTSAVHRATLNDEELVINQLSHKELQARFSFSLCVIILKISSHQDANTSIYFGINTFSFRLKFV